MAEVRGFYLLHGIQIISGAHSVYCLVAARSSFPDTKWPKHEDDDLCLSNVDIKNARSYASTPPYVCMV
jgi:hypothetical protein